MSELADWLSRAETLHPIKIDMSLDRLRPLVASLLGGGVLAKRVITVGGTNGKGSTCATLEALALAHGLRVGMYTSPHLIQFNERIRLQGEDATDALICEGFRAVEQLRGDVPLTYFEITTLVAFWLFARQSLDLVILEVGLGGRLDAVNCIDSDVAIITSVDLDHQSWLGTDREQIGREKAGILRAHHPVVLGESDPPAAVLDEAVRLESPIFRMGSTFDAVVEGPPQESQWSWKGVDGLGANVCFTRLHRNAFPLSNQACAIQAFILTGFQFHEPQIRWALANVRLRGRLQQVSDVPRIVLDVGHNPHAARFLRQVIERDQAGSDRPWIALFSALGDKDIEGVLHTLAPVMSHWHYWDMVIDRAAPRARLDAAFARLPATGHDNFKQALEMVLHEIQEMSVSDSMPTLLIFGSFHVVEDALVYFDALKSKLQLKQVELN